MNKTIFVIFGLAIGLILPPLSFALFFAFRPEILGVQRLEPSVFKIVNIRVLTLGLMMNAGAFFGALQLNWEGLARGILYATGLWMVAIFFYWFV
jgi:hypothetical protein